MTDLHSKERVTDEVLAERIEAAQGLLSAGYPSRTMRETLLIAIELQERRAGETSPELPAVQIYGTLTARDPNDVTRTLWTRTGHWWELLPTKPHGYHPNVNAEDCPQCSPVKTGADPHGS